MNHTPIKELTVRRCLSTGESVEVGTLAQNKTGVYFQYSTHYLRKFNSLSPFSLAFDDSLQLAPILPHNKLHGAFSDSLPDGWGLLLMDRVFKQNNILPTQITAMDRLAFVGEKAMGALSFSPCSTLKPADTENQVLVSELGIKAQQIFDGQTDEVLNELVNAGSSGGARPKAQLYIDNDNTNVCSTFANDNSNAFLVKFTSSQLALGHEEGVCEAVYLNMADRAGIEVPEYILLDAPVASGAISWLALKRFDVVQNSHKNNFKNDLKNEGRLHLHSASGLLDADYRLPSLDYEQLIKASNVLCKSPKAGQMMFRRMIFNLFSLNQDDHAKNWSFLQDDAGRWSLAPFYDVTFSPNPYNEHATAFAGFGQAPSLSAIQKLASHANFSSWSDAVNVIEETVAATSSFLKIAKSFDIKANTRKLIANQLNEVYQVNKGLMKK